ncbi:hypothetical protein CFOL_v3_19187, partial [Cephalotus follicularis]
FIIEFCILKIPIIGWVNRFANAGYAAMEVAGNTAVRLRQAKTKIVYRFLVGVTLNTGLDPDSPGISNTGTPRFQATWFKNLITSGSKPSTSSELENQDKDVLVHKGKQDSELLMQQNSQWQDSELPRLNSRHDS